MHSAYFIGKGLGAGVITTPQRLHFSRFTNRTKHELFDEIPYSAIDSPFDDDLSEDETIHVRALCPTVLLGAYSRNF